MTPKEKAQELLAKFYNISKGELQYPNEIVAYKAGKCALIAVDEIMDNIRDTTNTTIPSNRLMGFTVWWGDVRDELEAEDDIAVGFSEGSAYKKSTNSPGVMHGAQLKNEVYNALTSSIDDWEFTEYNASHKPSQLRYWTSDGLPFFRYDSCNAPPVSLGFRNWLKLWGWLKNARRMQFIQSIQKNTKSE